MSTLSIPGLIDGHVHLREPGGTHKEDVGSGTRAALAGGVVGVLDMPNNSPPTTNWLAFEDKRSRFDKKAVADYGLFAGYGGDDGYLDIASEAVGLKLYLDETFGDLTLREPRALARIFERWPGPGPIAVHAESTSIPRVLELARHYDQPIHVCHVPHPDDLLRIDEARQRGARITCEVTPHHLFLTRQDARRLGAYGQMKPPLLPAELVAHFWERLDLVDMLATDHAPHTREEKEGDSPPPGVPGLEIFLPLMLYAVDAGRLSDERMQELCYHGPLRVYGLQAPADSEVRVDLDEGRYQLPFEGYHTRCGWSPFAGQWALGRVRSVRLRGRVVWREGQLLAPPGYGQPLERVGSAR